MANLVESINKSVRSLCMSPTYYNIFFDGNLSEKIPVDAWS